MDSEEHNCSMEQSPQRCWADVVKWSSENLANVNESMASLLNNKTFSSVSPSQFMKFSSEAIVLLPGLDHNKETHVVLSLIRIMQEYCTTQATSLMIEPHMLTFMGKLLIYLRSDLSPDDVRIIFSTAAEVIGELFSLRPSQRTNYMKFLVSSLCSSDTPLEVLRAVFSFVNQDLESLDRTDRLRVYDSVKHQLSDVASLLCSCGDYDMQANIVEFLFRLTTHQERPQLAAKWLPSDDLRQAFVGIRNFDPDCRLLLNKLNERQGAARKVHSVAAQSVLLCGHQLQKPLDHRYEHFWVDFNEGSRMVMLYCQRPVANTEDNSLWASVMIHGRDVQRARLRLEAQTQVLTLILVCPCSSLLNAPDLENLDGNMVTMAFAKEHSLHSVLSRMYGNAYKFQSCEPLGSGRFQKCSVGVQGVLCRPAASASVSERTEGTKASMPLTGVCASRKSAPAAACSFEAASRRGVVPKSSVASVPQRVASVGRHRSSSDKYQQLEMVSPGLERRRLSSEPPAETASISQNSAESVIQPSQSQTVVTTSLRTPSTTSKQISHMSDVPVPLTTARDITPGDSQACSEAAAARSGTTTSKPITHSSEWTNQATIHSSQEPLSEDAGQQQQSENGDDSVPLSQPGAAWQDDDSSGDEAHEQSRGQPEPPPVETERGARQTQSTQQDEVAIPPGQALPERQSPQQDTPPSHVAPAEDRRTMTGDEAVPESDADKPTEVRISSRRMSVSFAPSAGRHRRSVPHYCELSSPTGGDEMTLHGAANDDEPDMRYPPELDQNNNIESRDLPASAWGKPQLRGHSDTVGGSHIEGEKSKIQASGTVKHRHNITKSKKEVSTCTGSSKSRSVRLARSSDSESQLSSYVERNLFSISDSDSDGPVKRRKAKRAHSSKSPRIFSDASTGSDIHVKQPSFSPSAGKFKRCPVYDPHSERGKNARPIRNKALLYGSATEPDDVRQRGGKGSARGGKGDVRGGKGDVRDGKGAARGSKAAARGSKPAARGSKAAARGSKGAARGDKGAAGGEKGAARGAKGAARGGKSATRSGRGGAHGARGGPTARKPPGSAASSDSWTSRVHRTPLPSPETLRDEQPPAADERTAAPERILSPNRKRCRGSDIARRLGWDSEDEAAPSESSIRLSTVPVPGPTADLPKTRPPARKVQFSSVNGPEPEPPQPEPPKDATSAPLEEPPQDAPAAAAEISVSLKESAPSVLCPPNTPRSAGAVSTPRLVFNEAMQHQSELESSLRVLRPVSQPGTQQFQLHQQQPVDAAGQLHQQQPAEAAGQPQLSIADEVRAAVGHSGCSGEGGEEPGLLGTVAFMRRELEQLQHNDDSLLQLGRRSAAALEQQLRKQFEAIDVLQQLASQAASARAQAAGRILTECERLERGGQQMRAPASDDELLAIQRELQLFQTLQ